VHHRRLYGSLALDSQRGCLRSRILSVGDQCRQAARIVNQDVLDRRALFRLGCRPLRSQSEA